MALLVERPLDWAGRHGAERLTAVGVLALRPRRYLSDGVPPALATIAGLRLRVDGFSELPYWHVSTGLYGYLRLPAGEWRIEIDDPARRYLAQAVLANVPDRRGVRQALEAGGVPPPGSPGPLLLDLALRPSPEMALPPGGTALWGVLRDSVGGRPVVGAVLSLATVNQGLADTVSTLSGVDGSYLLVLPGEVIDRSVNPPQRNFERLLTVRRPLPALSTTLAQRGLLAGQPADVFTLSSVQRDALFAAPAVFRLRAGNGDSRSPVNGQNPLLPLVVGQRGRWDVELLP
ncbi:MAG TPA: hypothetical protein PKN13_13660 [Accumulibacter sp.]|nr:hypothetical protein [Accumulibacter sp.]HMW18928.1 hypothetical protein [Accumulibacter sp.]HMX23913.1 hypothetical protein [Accumulibacter sp.]HMY07058.1 hypothetical protein [Accumulibacter sp.]HNC19074.1 hypothetical protein [Accumulibacter sp.]